MSLYFVVVSAVEDEACTDWRQMVEGLNTYSRSSSSSSGMELHCTYHPEKCEQADCVGKMNVPLVGALEFCWRLVLNHCDNPLSMDISIATNKYNIHFDQRVLHDQRYELPVGNLNLPKLPGTSQKEFLSITLEKVNATAVRIGAKLSTELCYSTFGCTVTANIPVLSKTVVRVSKCTKVTQTPTPTSNCFNRNGSSSGGKSNTTIDGGGIKWSDLFTTTKMPPHSTVKSPTYGKNCSISLLVEQCGQNEICKLGSCECFTPLYPMCMYTGLCETEEQCEKHIIPDFIKKSSQVAPQDNGSSSETALIVGSTLGGIVLIAIIAGIILVLMKRDSNSCVLRVPSGLRLRLTVN
uniref:Uncharacterized protein n=1 Tax=Magallana gigas TaxID=29159 RepID=K1PTA0_MAGGI